MKRLLAFQILILLLASPVGAEESLLTLDEAVAEVLAANPDVQAAHYRSAAAKARIPQAKALDDPMVGVMFDDVPRDTWDPARSEEIDYWIEQKIPFPGKRYVRGKAARFEAQSISERSRGNIQDVLLDLKTTYYEVYRLERQLEINRENQRLFRQFLGSAETWYAAGGTTAYTPLKAQVELSKLKNEEIQLDQQHLTHLAHLKATLNRPTEDKIRLPSKLKWPRLSEGLEEISSLALETRPELQALEAATKRDRSQLTSAKQGLLPDFSLGFQYGQRPQAQDTWSGTVMINLPIFFGSKNLSEIREAKASLKATEAERESIRIHTSHEIAEAYSAVKAAERLIASYQKGILPQARTNLEAARVAYASKGVDFLTLIEAALTYKNLQMSFYESQADLGISYARLERLVGRDLQKGERP